MSGKITPMDRNFPYPLSRSAGEGEVQPTSRLCGQQRSKMLASAAYASMLLVFASAVDARVLLTQKQALNLAFPSGSKVERKTAYLTKEQVDKAQELARAPVSSRIWNYYVGASTSGTVGYAYFETHTVRTMPETFMAVLDRRGQLKFIELLAFHEPEDYQPPARWLKQFEEKSLKDDLFVHRGILNITGASLTSTALSEGIRRVLAVHAVLHPENK